MNITELSQKIHQNSVAKGFWEDKENKNVGELLMLAVSELGEALEAHRTEKFANLNQLYKSSIDMNFEDNFIINVKDTFEDEIADTIIRLLDTCAGLGIEIETHIKLKMEYNSSRPYKHGKKY